MNKKAPLEQKNIVIYQAKNGAIELRGDFEHETVWATLDQIANLFGVQKAAISKHFKNIFESGELAKKATVSILETVRIEGKREVRRTIEMYNLDAIIAAGYRVNSKQATQFRIWASQIIKKYLIDGYAINKKLISKNHSNLLKAIENIKKLSKGNELFGSQETLDLVKVFANTWVSLEAYDEQNLPKKGVTKKSVKFTAEELEKSILDLKNDLIKKKEATDLFAQEKKNGSFAGIVGNIFQSFGGKDLYPSIEEKAVHLLYFVVKNHVFNDGNKRSGAFSFI